METEEDISNYRFTGKNRIAIQSGNDEVEWEIQMPNRNLLLFHQIIEDKTVPPSTITLHRVSKDDEQKWEIARIEVDKGKALANLGKHKEAIEYYDKALQVYPRNAVAWNNKGFALRSLNRYEEAIECYDKALQIDSGYAFAWDRKGFVLDKLGRMDEALDAYLQLKELAPDYKGIHYNLGSLYLKMGKWEDAKEELKRAIESNASEPKTHYNLGTVYLQLGETDNAVAEYNRAISVQDEKKKINPNVADFGGGYLGLGNIYYSQKQWEDASQNYKRGMQLGEKNAKIFVRLGSCYFNMKDFPKAKQNYEEALKIDPSLTKIREFVEQLDKIIESSENGRQ